MPDACDQSEQDLMKMHVEALYAHDDQGRLQTVNEPNGDRVPRFFFGRTPVGNVWRFHADLPADLVDQLEALCVKEPIHTDFRRPQYWSEYMNILEQHSPVEESGGGPAYRFPDRIPATSMNVVEITTDNAEILSRGFEEWVSEIPHVQPFLAVVVADRPVSLCRSVRITSQAHEAGVKTHPEFRREGYATDVVAAWATAVQKIGCIPLYSTTWENTASQGLAENLSLVQYGADFSIM